MMLNVLKNYGGTLLFYLVLFVGIVLVNNTLFQ